jgi:hypothetical protein
VQSILPVGSQIDLLPYVSRLAHFQRQKIRIASGIRLPLATSSAPAGKFQNAHRIPLIGTAYTVQG